MEKNNVKIIRFTCFNEKKNVKKILYDLLVLMDDQIKSYTL